MKKTSFVGAEFFHHFHLELIAYLLLALLIMSRSAWADIAVYKQMGPHIIPIESKAIAIEEEHLDVTMHSEWSRIRARLIMKNDGGLQDLKVGLPQAVISDEQIKHFYGPYNRGRREGLWDVSLTVDGKPVPYHLSRGKITKDDNPREKAIYLTDQGTSIEFPLWLGIDTYSGLMNWLSWDLPFQPGQKREISVAYSVENCRHKKSLSLMYLLETARLWQNGRIHKLTIKADFGEGFGTTLLRKKVPPIEGGYLREAPFYEGFMCYCRYEVHFVHPGGYQMKGKNFIWNLTDYTPENLSIRVESIAPILCSSVLDNKIDNGPQMAIDGRLDTAWVPSRPTGESIIIPLCPRDELFGSIDYEKHPLKEHTLKGLRIFSGCGRSPELFTAYNRPKTIEILGTTFELKNICAWQYIELPGALLDRIHADSRRWGEKVLAMKIIDVYRGSRYDSAYITEVEPVFE